MTFGKTAVAEAVQYNSTQRRAESFTLQIYHCLQLNAIKYNTLPISQLHSLYKKFCYWYTHLCIENIYYEKFLLTTLT